MDVGVEDGAICLENYVSIMDKDSPICFASLDYSEYTANIPSHSNVLAVNYS